MKILHDEFMFLQNVEKVAVLELPRDTPGEIMAMHCRSRGLVERTARGWKLSPRGLQALEKYRAKP